MSREFITPEQDVVLERVEVYDWVKGLLSSDGGDIQRNDAELSRFINMRKRHVDPLIADDQMRSMVNISELDRLEEQLRVNVREGLVELSAALLHYGGVQAVVARGERDEVIDLVGVAGDGDLQAVLVDSTGVEHPYANFKALLMPSGEGDE